MLPNPWFDKRAGDGDWQSAKELSVGLCLSGGGFRASLFHLGVMRGLHRVGVLERIDSISAVSGGSIVAAAYGIAVARAQKEEREFDFDVFEQEMVTCIRRGVRGAVVRRLFDPRFAYQWYVRRHTRTDLLADEYRRVLFGEARIGDLPERPLILLNVTCLNNGESWAFSRDGLFGMNSEMLLTPDGHRTDVALGVAVAASSAVPGLFPPLFRERSEFFDAAVEIGYGFEPGFGELSKAGREAGDAFNWLAFSDGGVVDNTGLGTLSYRQNPNVVLISDGGGYFEILSKPPRSLVLGYVPVVGRSMFGSAGIFARVVEIMKYQLTTEQTMRYPTGEGWLAHKYVFSLSDPTLDGLDHETVDLLRLVRTDLDGFSETEIRGLLTHGEAHVYHYLQLQLINQFAPLLAVTGHEVRHVDAAATQFDARERRHLEYSPILNGVVRSARRALSEN